LLSDYGAEKTNTREDARCTRHQIFNRLCAAYRRSKDPGFVRADDLRQELAIPEDVFAGVLTSFINSDSPRAVEVFEKGGETFLRLAESARYNCEPGARRPSAGICMFLN
jgi:hypothetical protein